jgi:hypothetical protein
MKDMSTSPIISKLSCGHEYHPECIDEWLRLNPSCPLCRGEDLVARRRLSESKHEPEPEIDPEFTSEEVEVDNLLRSLPIYYMTRPRLRPRPVPEPASVSLPRHLPAVTTDQEQINEEIRRQLRYERDVMNEVRRLIRQCYQRV